MLMITGAIPIASVAAFAELDETGPTQPVRFGLLLAAAATRFDLVIERGLDKLPSLVAQYRQSGNNR
jgi:hypothetical protein